MCSQMQKKKTKSSQAGVFDESVEQETERKSEKKSRKKKKKKTCEAETSKSNETSKETFGKETIGTQAWNPSHRTLSKSSSEKVESLHQSQVSKKSEKILSHVQKDEMSGCSSQQEAMYEQRLSKNGEKGVEETLSRCQGREENQTRRFLQHHSAKRAPLHTFASQRNSEISSKSTERS